MAADWSLYVLDRLPADAVERHRLSDSLRTLDALIDGGLEREPHVELGEIHTYSDEPTLLALRSNPTPLTRKLAAAIVRDTGTLGRRSNGPTVPEISRFLRRHHGRLAYTLIW